MVERQDFHTTGWSDFVGRLGCTWLFNMHDFVQITRGPLLLYYRCQRCGRRMSKDKIHQPR